MKKLSLFLVLSLVLLVGLQVAAQEDPVTLVVWDWISSDPQNQEYYTQAIASFEEANPNVTIEHVPQPYNEYYTLLQTAVSTNQVPDLALFNGGSHIRDRVSALTPLDDQIGDVAESLVGWEAFTGDDGSIYAIPILMQGHVIYFNKSLYEAAGLDPETPPTTLAELEANCAAILENTDAACFSMGNREGFHISWSFSTWMLGIWDEAQEAAWFNGEMDWTDPSIMQLFEFWESTRDAGWYPEGVNSMGVFPDAVETFLRGDAAHFVGLISVTAHWKEFEEFMGAENVGVFRPVDFNPGDDFDPASLTFAIDGGTGYAIPQGAEHPELALAYAKHLANAENLQTFTLSAGIISPNIELDTDAIESPNAGEIIGWLGCCTSRTPHVAPPSEENRTMQLEGQNLFNGDVTAADMAAAIQAIRDGAESE